MVVPVRQNRIRDRRREGAASATVIGADREVLAHEPEKPVDPRLRGVPEALEKRIQQADRELRRQRDLSERRKRNPIIDLWSRPARNENVIKRFQLVQQAEEMDCGAACLAMICRHYGINMTLGKLRELANVTREGATLESLAKVVAECFTPEGLLAWKKKVSGGTGWKGRPYSASGMNENLVDRMLGKLEGQVGDPCLPVSK